MLFANRTAAAQMLAKKLQPYRGQSPLVLAIPRGAVPMAQIIAEQLEGEMDVVLVRKLRSPYSAEFAIGSVDESGWSYVADYAAEVGADPDYVARETACQLEIIKKRREQYTPVRPPIDPGGRIVIVIDDGLATGATMISALHALRERKPKKLVCAVPVSPADTLLKIEKLADETLCLETPDNFSAVGQFYADFPQVEDEEVIAILQGLNT